MKFPPARTACLAAAADVPREQPKAEGDYQDVVYFAEGRPLLIRVHTSIDSRPLSKVWDDCITKVFKYLDANGDGFLDQKEIQRVPTPDVLFGTGTGAAAPTMAQLDADGGPVFGHYEGDVVRRATLALPPFHLGIELVMNVAKEVEEAGAGGQQLGEALGRGRSGIGGGQFQAQFLGQLKGEGQRVLAEFNPRRLLDDNFLQVEIVATA